MVHPASFPPPNFRSRLGAERVALESIREAQGQPGSGGLLLGPPLTSQRGVKSWMNVQVC